jgi:hypothetical protein
LDRLAQAVPLASELLQRAAHRGDNLGTITAALLRLLDRYGAAELQAAIGEALARDVPHPNAVRLALERARHEQGLPPPTELHLSEQAARCDAPVPTHALEGYDRIYRQAARADGDPTDRPSADPSADPAADPSAGAIRPDKDTQR